MSSERFIYRICGIQAEEDMAWTRYALVMLAFNVVGLLFVYLLQRVQQWLPLNPQDFPAVSPHSALNTAISFATNTNWQGYGGESTMSYLTQMLGLAVQNFLSAATGVAVLIALIRGFVRRTASGIGNFWVDMTRCTLYVLLPLSFVFALILAWQGVPQNFKPYATVPLVEATTATEPVKDAEGNTVKDADGKDVTKETKVTEQSLPLGPAASQIAIKQLGTNGGGCTASIPRIRTNRRR
jgi:K+-transporting ATPase ATPase A chain